MNQPAHALFSPSSASKWMRCFGSLAMEDGLPDDTASYADEGTAAHELASWVLTDGVGYASAYEGRIIHVINGRVWDVGTPRPAMLKGQTKDIERVFEVTEDMAEHVQTYADAIFAKVEGYKLAGATRVTLLVEKRVEFSETVGVPGQFGTSDAIILVEWADGTALVDVNDLKFGYGMVYAPENEQLMMYALAVLETYGVLANFTQARMTIHQPRRDHVSEWECSVADLIAFGQEAKAAAAKAHEILILKRQGFTVTSDLLTPGDKQCQWCKRKGDCPALARWAEESIGAEFEDLTKENIRDYLPDEIQSEGETIARYLRMVPLFDIFAKGILARAESFMFNGGIVPGWKVVPGKKGNRSWGDNAGEVEETLKSMRLRIEEMYKLKLISPTQAEKLLKKSNPRRWARLQQFIVQKEGQPSIAEAADSREPLVITKVEDDFEVIPDGQEGG